jgi:cytochrome c nitrite reductase small subunit
MLLRNKDTGGYIRVKKTFLISILLFPLIVSLPLFTLGSSSPPAGSGSDYCISCHAMESQYEAWSHSGSHRRKMCVDCHLPNENKVVHYLWKSIDGLKDVLIFHSGKVPEPIKISSHGEKVLQANCIRCHETTVMLMDRERKCWNCHRRISHMHTGIRETF